MDIMGGLTSKDLRRDAGRAAAAILWSEGVTQKTIAVAFGLTSAPPVNTAIKDLIVKYCPEATTQQYPFSSARFPRAFQDARRPVARLAAQRYMESRSG